MNNIKFPYYPSNVKIVKPLGLVSLKDFIRANKNPNKKTRELFEQIQKASLDGDMKLKAKLKESLYYFNPCVNTDGLGRSYSNITSFTGLAVIEFDKISFAKELKESVFNNLPSCVCAYISPSGYGVKFIIRIPIAKSIEEFKSYIYGLGYYFEHISGWDGSCQNPILPLYLSWDEDLLYREDAEIWDVKGLKLNSFKAFEGDIEVLENVTEKEKNTVIKIFSRGIDNIVDNGHPQVLSFSVMLWGYVGANYLSEDEAEILIEEKIEENEYLSKGTQGYITSAKKMKSIGMSSPLYLRNYDKQENI